MTDTELAALRPGDLVTQKGTRWQTYVVTENLGNLVTAVRSVVMANPHEWESIPKVAYREPVP